MHFLVWVGVPGAFFLAAGLLRQEAVAPTTGMAVITEERVRECVSYLASDLMRGRNTPSPELDSCANFLARRMGALGLDTSVQRFSLLQAHLGEQNSLMVHKDGQRFVYRLHKDFVPAHLSRNGEMEAPVAFVGYGVTGPEYGYDDYQGVEVAGKAVLLFIHELQERDTASLFAGERETPHSSLYQKVANALAHEAAGVLVVTDPNNHTFAPPAREWVSKGQMGNPLLVTLEEREERQVVVMRVGKRLAEELLAPSGRSLSSLQTDIDSALAPQSFVLPGVTVSMRASLSPRRPRTQNVFGVLTGEDPVLRQQVVVVGAHYDHLRARGDSLIFNGADDNASGTAGLLAIAEAFAASGMGPKRTVVFCAFAGGERGLYGSRYYYVANPHLPLRDTVATLNMDMIGRNDTAAVEVVGADSTSWLRALMERANMAVGLRLRFRSRKVIASAEAMPFAWRGVATLTFTNGQHADYHQPSDDVERLALGHLANVARLVYITAWLLANEDLPASAMPIAPKQPHGQSSGSGSSRQ